MIARSQLLVLVVALSACQATPERPASDKAASVSAPSSNVGTAPPGASASEALDKLDTRTPLPLLPMMAQHQKQNMRDHLAAVQEVVAALGRKDFPGIEKAVTRIGYSPTMGQMCTHMGAGAPGFTETALAFHHTADKIGKAASQHELDGVVTALAETLGACTACHATYKQHVVDEATWASLTGDAPGPSKHQHP